MIVGLIMRLVGNNARETMSKGRQNGRTRVMTCLYTSLIFSFQMNQYCNLHTYIGRSQDVHLYVVPSIADFEAPIQPAEAPAPPEEKAAGSMPEAEAAEHLLAYFSLQDTLSKEALMFLSNKVHSVIDPNHIFWSIVILPWAASHAYFLRCMIRI